MASPHMMPHLRPGRHFGVSAPVWATLIKLLGVMHSRVIFCSFRA